MDTRAKLALYAEAIQNVANYGKAEDISDLVYYLQEMENKNHSLFREMNIIVEERGMENLDALNIVKE